MKSSKKIAIIIDHPVRDLQGNTLLAENLADKGHQVFLVPMRFQARDIFAIAPDYVLINYFRENNKDFIEKIIDSNIKLALLDTEGGFFDDELSEYKKVVRFNDNILKNVTRVFTWGRRLTEFWTKEAKLPREKVTETGSPRFDLYHSNYRFILNKKKPVSIPTSPYFLFNTKVMAGNRKFMSPKKEFLLRRRLGFSREEIETMISLDHQYLKEFPALAKKVAQKFPNTPCIIRPHPFENKHFYEDFLSPDLSNFFVFQQGEVLPWLAGACALVHRHCISAIEAALLGTPSISPQWIQTAAFSPGTEEVSYRPQSREEFFELLENAQKGKLLVPDFARQTLSEIIPKWLHQMDGKNFERVSRQIQEDILSSPHKSADLKKCKKYLYEGFKNRTGMGKIYHWYHLLAQKTSPSLLWMTEHLRYQVTGNKSKRFDKKDIVFSSCEKYKISSYLSDETIDSCPPAGVKIFRS
ncbi:MAG: hypothetical protein OXB88_06330 [Bacteriovoracales bacterium]|nr:hypothetical protein [Bacteriovoracales bacterium]